MEILWRSKENDLVNRPGSLSPLAQSDYPLLVHRLLLARGFADSETVSRFISPKLSELRDPFRMLSMEKACDRLVEAFVKKEKICVYADFDLDGTSGLALLEDGFRQLGFADLVLAQPKRLSEGYGFHSHIVEDLHRQGVSLIVTVDVGITAFAAGERAQALGVDVIITDHHQMAETLPKAFCVVNPNQRGDHSQLGFLCGAGVAFYLLRGLKRKLIQAKLIAETALDLKSLLDCFCIATLTDMVPLVEDNRTLVKLGIRQLEQTRRPGLRALLEALDLSGRPLSSQDVAIRFAPKLNALSRMENGILPIDLYVAKDMETAREMVKMVLLNNSTRMQLQGAGEAEAFDFLKTWPHKKFVFLASRHFHKGIVGLIATKISQQENVPVFVGAINEEGIMTGSARLPNGSQQSLLKAFAAGSEYLVRFGGHEAAAGFELAEKNQDSFVTALVDYYENQKNPEARFLDFDVEAELHEVTENLMRWFEVLGPFGQNCASPLLCFRRVSVREVIQLKGGHLKFKLEERNSLKRFEGMYFSPPPGLMTDEMIGRQIDVLGEVQWNYFAGKKTIQILIKDFKLSGESE